MLLSDRDIRAEIEAGRVGCEPFHEAMIQPSSVDVRLDKYFRVFENHKYSVIDPSNDLHVAVGNLDMLFMEEEKTSTLHVV